MNLKYYGSLHVPSGLCLLEKMLHLSFLWRSIHWGTTPCAYNHRCVRLGLAPWGGPSGHWEVARNAVWNSSAAAPTGYWLISTINTKVSLRLAHLIISDALEPTIWWTELFSRWAEPSQVKITYRNRANKGRGFYSKIIFSALYISAFLQNFVFTHYTQLHKIL